ncbi:MAG: hypothetical protein K2J12_06670 [Muribaculaceae bacterium]|nr:hypothetical protein [Muribaculaceae bacterium]
MCDINSLPVLINVFGVGEIGKTKTLATLYSQIQNTSSFHYIQDNQINSDDFWAIFNYKGKTVGIITMGDPGSEDVVDKFLNNCSSHHCDIIFTASRTRGEIFGMVMNYANTNGYVFIETSPLHMRFPNGYNGNYNFLHSTFASMLETLI